MVKRLTTIFRSGTSLQRRFRLTAALLVCALFVAPMTAEAVERDVVLMIDNSGSMRQNDPNFLTREAAAEFIDALDEQTRLAVLLFDHRIRMVFPLTPITMQARAQILEGLDQINFKGQRTNIPAAMERGIYELKHQGRPDAQKSIVFITDGIVDTGDRQNDRQKTEWLRKNLAQDAAQNHIRIFGVAFTDQADFELIQSLAQKTGSAYFRAFDPEDISQVFGEINRLITAEAPSEPAAAKEPPTAAPSPPAQAAPAAAPAPVATAPAPSAAQPSANVGVPPPPQQPVAAPQSGSDNRWLIAVLVVLVIFVAAAVVFLVWPRKKATLIRSVAGGETGQPAAGDMPVSMPGAYLKDLTGVTGKPTIDLDQRMMKVGRLAGTESNPINDIVINKGTISRLHAIIEFKRHGFWVVDQGSANGCFVNGQRISQEVRLKHGDTVAFDTFDFEFIVKEISQSDLGDADRTVFRREDETLLESPQVQMAALRSAFGKSDDSDDSQPSQDSLPSSGGAYKSPEELQRSGPAKAAAARPASASPADASPIPTPSPDPHSDLSAAPPEYRPEDENAQEDQPPAVSPEAPTGEYEPLPPDDDESASEDAGESHSDHTALNSDPKPRT